MRVPSILGAVIACSFFATASIASSLFPSALAENTTGQPDAIFLGPPISADRDSPGDGWLGIGGEMVTFDFLQNRIVDGIGPDFNVYEATFGGPEFPDITVFASADGISFIDITSTAGPGLRLLGDEDHGDLNFVMSYDLSGSLSAARFIRIDGVGSNPAIANNNFDLDAIGAINFSIEPIPLPLGGILLLTSLPALVLFAGRRRNMV